MASSTQQTQIWVNSRSWWWTRSPGVLQSVGSQRVRHNWATERNWIVIIITLKKRFSKENLSNQNKLADLKHWKTVYKFFWWLINLAGLLTYIFFLHVSSLSLLLFSCSVMSDSATPWTAACQASLNTVFPIYSQSPNNTGICGTNPSSPNSPHSWKSAHNFWLP